MPLVIQEIQKIVELPQVLFTDEVVGMPIAMKGKCVRLRRAEHLEVATDPVHRQDLLVFPWRCNTTFPQFQCDKQQMLFRCAARRVAELPQAQHTERNMDIEVVRQRQTSAIQTVQKTAEDPQNRQLDPVVWLLGYSDRPQTIRCSDEHKVASREMTDERSVGDSGDDEQSEELSDAEVINGDADGNKDASNVWRVKRSRSLKNQRMTGCSRQGNSRVLKATRMVAKQQDDLGEVNLLQVPLDRTVLSQLGQEACDENGRIPITWTLLANARAVIRFRTTADTVRAAFVTRRNAS